MSKTKQLLEKMQYPDWLLDAEYQEWLENVERPAPRNESEQD